MATSHTVPILDSHIHLFPASELPTLAWNRPGAPLLSQHSVSEYRAASSSSADILAGFIFIETDRKPDSALAEVSFLARIAAGRPRAGEGHSGEDRGLCMGIVPWAPVHAGPEALEGYLRSAEETCARDGDGAAWGKVKGFRYLLQDKPDGTMLAEGFVQGVRLLGRRGFAFDVGVDLHRRGRGQLEEVVGLVERAHEGVGEGDKVTFILNHLCKPDMTNLNTSDPSFIAWRTAIFTLSKADNVYMKLSGAFSEMDPDLARASPDDIFMAISPWLAVVVAAFGPSRLMFGSDWPVCTVPVEHAGGEEVEEGSWDKWRKVVERLCFMSSFSEDETRMVFYGTAKKAYGIE